VAVLVVAGAVVGVVVAGVVVGVVVFGVVLGVVVGAVDEGVVVDADGGALATLVDGEEPPVAEAPGSEPSVREADLVWKVSTPASPAMVAPITIGVRLMSAVSSEWTWRFSGLTT
jgi:hypothetical protein